MLSVIVPVYRNANLVEYSLTSLLDNLPADAELIVVDDASGPETVQLLGKFPRARVVQHRDNRGNTAAYNTGASAARGDVLVFADSDVFVCAGLLDEFRSLLESDPTLGAVGTVLLYPQDYTIQHAGIAFDKWALSHVYVGRRLADVHLAPLEERQAVTAALFASRRAVFQEIGGFDETYRDGLEDVEYCLRCLERGYRNVMTSRHPALHIESATRAPYKHIRRTYNYSIFFSRWSGRFRPDLLDYVRASASVLLATRSNIPVYPAAVLNFSASPNWVDLPRILSELGVEVSTMHDLSGALSESDSIDLFKMVPLAFQRLRSGIVFVVDHFVQAKGNRSWFQRRGARDLVIDRHANVLISDQFGFQVAAQ